MGSNNWNNFYFTIDRDLKTGIENFNKDIVEPIDKKVVELTGIETPEMFVEKKNNYK